MIRMINSLSISFPDFKLQEIINPDEFDQNNADIVNKINSILGVLNQITDSVNDGGSGADAISLTPISSFTSNKLQTFLEDVTSRLQSTDSVSSGAGFIGAPTISGVTGSTVSAQLSSLKQILDALKVIVDSNVVSVAKLSENKADKNIATPTQDGLMSKSDKIFLNSLTTSRPVIDYQEMNRRVDNVENRVVELEENTQLLNIFKSNKDDNGVFRVIEFDRHDGTLYQRSELIEPNLDGLYNKQIVHVYDVDGITIKEEYVYILSYDTDGNVVSEVKL